MSRRTGWRRSQRGTAAIEFAALFMVFFMLVYGMVGYVIPLVLLSSYNEISANAVRAAMQIPSGTVDYNDRIEYVVGDVISHSWLGARPAAWRDKCQGESRYTRITHHANEGVTALSVCISHNTPETIIAPMQVFGWRFPQLPETLTGRSEIRIGH
ncbi:pilus assembly protein [Pseudomonas sp. ABC1]|uniref:TadE/TadG family type IV pilus assembly protein n=1 Tax=Pseudomonas sp. ABC1 TaxID=2748080 RepID=UPI0015C3C2A6|nr:TadE/TadG family type IV pilus assembly protein [Pseudomonas sp. ABC1]QLF93152.1 pilus assembly protein [Pseudomonas sp. ABC1]